MAYPFDQASAADVAQSIPAGDLDDDGLDMNDATAAQDTSDEVDYYSLLGLSPNPPPTDSQIRAAYHNLSLSFHPDKQPAHRREAAERQFTRIQQAYDTLSDPKKRVVYDLVGAEGVEREWNRQGLMGLNGEGREVGVKSMTPDEFRRWFSKTMKNRERKFVNSLVAPRVSHSRKPSN